MKEMEPEAEIMGWKEKYSAQVCKRKSEEIHPRRVKEQIGLVCKVKNPRMTFVIEIKDKLNKKAIGQTLMYWYAYNRDLSRGLLSR